MLVFFFFFSSRRRHTRYWRDWSSDVCSSDLSWNSEMGLFWNYQTVSLERLSGKCSVAVMVAYAPRHGEQEIPHGPVRRRVELPRPASSRAHRTRTPQAPRLTGDPRRRLLRPQERMSVAVAAEGLPTLEDGLRLVQEVAHRRNIRASQRRPARAPAEARG